MILSFSQTINGKPNYFIEKIISGLYQKQIIPISLACELFRSYEGLSDERLKYVDTSRGVIESINPKLHTIREYRKTKDGARAEKQWNAGDDIHLSINPRSPNYFQFAPIIKCVSVQEIKIRYDHEHDEFPMVFIDGYALHEREDHVEILTQLAINDGFDDIDGFFNYFDKNFTGVIIRWTDLKY